MPEVKSIKSRTVIDGMTFMRAPCTYKKTVSPSIGIAIVNNIMHPTMLFQKCLAQENPASTVNHIGFMNKLLTTFSQRRIPS